MLQNEIIDAFSANVERRLLELNKIGSSAMKTVAEAVVLEKAYDEPLKDSFSEARQQAMEAAALCGWFEPGEFVADMDKDLHERMLNELISFCISDTSGSKVLWFMKQERRVDIIRSLITERRLQDVAQNAPARKNDRYAFLLRELIEKGTAINVAEKSQSDLIILISILEMLHGVKELAKPDADEVRTYLDQAKYLSEYELLITNFVGRKEEIEKLSTFISDPENYYTWRGVILTGFGGAGKSSLLAKFAFDMVHGDSEAPPVIVLDFDKPGMDPTDSQWLEAEMADQVAAQYPEYSNMLQEAKNISASLRRKRPTTRYNVQAESKSIGRSSRDPVLRTINRVISQKLPGSKSLVLILDTYEEVVHRDLSERLTVWLDDVYDILSDFNVRVIFSGRLFDDAIESLKTTGRIVDVIKVEDFDREITITFLQHQGLDDTLAEQVADSELLPHRPLELKLLAKALLAGDITMRELEEEMRNGGERAKELFSGLVYKRVMQRITNEVAQTLAFPGFVLRYLTPELIQKVLVPALELPYMDEYDAQNAINTLSSHTWLTARSGSQQLWHRRDLRRSMLKLMIADRPDEARRIHEAAIKFFGDKESGEDRAESMYHRLMMVEKPTDGEMLELVRLKDVYSFIVPDIADLPDPARILLRYANNMTPAVHEIECLPNRYLREAYHSAGESLTGNREFGKAYKLLKRGEEAGVSAGRGSHGEFNWEKEALFATVNWERRNWPAMEIVHLRHLYEILFYDSITHPWAVSLQDVRFAINSLTRSTKNIEITSAFVRQRIMFCLINLIYRIKPAQFDLYKQFQMVNDIFRHDLTQADSQRNRMLLGMVSGDISREYYLSHFTIKLNVKWLTDLTEFVSGSKFHSNRLVANIRAVEKLLSAPIVSLRSAFSIIDSAYSSNENVITIPGVKERFTRQEIDIVRGPDPEFRDPCRFALLEVFTDLPSRKKLAEIISIVTELGVPELEPDRFAKAMQADPERFLELYVEFVDRTWGLGELMKRALDIYPEATKLNLVYTAYRTWDETVNNILKKKYTL